MPFGRADRARLQRIENQLTTIITNLAALKQQVDDQQHALDQARRDANTAISTGLAEIRAVARDATNRTTDLAAKQLTQVHTELVAVRSAITSLDQQINTQAATQSTAPAESEPEPEPQQEAEPETAPEPDPSILRAAAGISHATLDAHRDTWATLIQTAGNEKHFHIPGKVEDHEGFITVRFSGPSLAAAITSLNRVSRTAPSPVTRAIAHHIHGKITAAVQEILDNPHHGDSDGKPVRIVIDDRPARPQPDAE